MTIFNIIMRCVPKNVSFGKSSLGELPFDLLLGHQLFHFSEIKSDQTMGEEYHQTVIAPPGVCTIKFFRYNLHSLKHNKSQNSRQFADIRINKI